MSARRLQRQHNNKTTLLRCRCVSCVFATSAHSQNQVSAYFTSAQIMSIESAVTNNKEAVTSVKKEVCT